MADSYLSISQIAADSDMNDRVRACSAQQGVEDPGGWTLAHQLKWASSPSWGEKWDSALASHPPDPDNPYYPGADPAVISDADILSTVQLLIAADPEPAP